MVGRVRSSPSDTFMLFFQTKLISADFFVEIEGHRSDPPVSAALDSLKGESHSVVILGSFPTAADPVQ